MTQLSQCPPLKETSVEANQHPLIKISQTGITAGMVHFSSATKTAAVTKNIQVPLTGTMRLMGLWAKDDGGLRRLS